MTNEDDSSWIVFNGEIYNHATLRREMERAGHRYRTRSDTETILHLYEEYGSGCVDRLQGMFAFAIWDGRQRRLLLARDRLGIKPLYYACTDRELVFASEIKGIVASGALKVAFNEAILPEFLANRYVAGTETFYKGIRKLLPGHLLEWSAEQGLRVHRYWHPPQECVDDGVSLAEQADRLRTGLQQAVQSHLMSDVPLGLFLSGGLDSSGLAALMAPLMPQPVKTFAVGFAEREANELQYARIVAQAIGTEHHEVLVSAEQFMEVLPKLVWHEDDRVCVERAALFRVSSRKAACEGGVDRRRRRRAVSRIRLPLSRDRPERPHRARLLEWHASLPAAANRRFVGTFAAPDTTLCVSNRAGLRAGAPWAVLR